MTRVIEGTREKQQAGDAQLGRTLGGFVIRARLGEGGFAEVYLAEQPALAREAVIKVLRAQHSGETALIQRFLREARLASRLDHPYAAHVYAFGAEPDGLLWIAMERVRGTSLEELLKHHGPLSLERFTPLLQRICEVVHTAHQQGMIHRDLKPANVMVLSRAGRLLPKLLDFGIAKAAGGQEEPLEEASALEAPPEEPGGTGAHPLRGLTRRGVVLGSPHFMAPEQWVNPADVDARTDLYALGALAYEALTGRHAFDGATLRELALAHARNAPPRLGPEFPSALEDVLARAMAKRPGERFESALEFAEAFREAAGGPSAPEEFPRLDEAIRDAVLADAPQPLAEAVARLDAARHLFQAREAMWQVRRVSLRYVCLLALAAQAAGARGASEEAAELLKALRRRGLSDEEWLELARAVCSPFASRPEAFPIPSLITFLFARGAQGAERLEALAALEAGGGQGSGEAQVREQLVQGLHLLEALLRELSFLADYPLVVHREAWDELWMGVRRGQRAALSRGGRPLPEGQPVLTDRDGTPLVLLWPLLQVGRPAPGVPEELFLLEGRARNPSATGAARMVSLPSGFERTDEALWDWFARHLLAAEDEPEAGRIEERPPYLGLASFSPADSGFFFGREREVEIALNRLRLQPLLAVVGPSGAGKSSFVQAGIIPALPAGWQAIVLRPGASPLAVLSARLACEGLAVEDLRATLSRDPEALGALLRAAAQDWGRSLLLVVDQFEELFTLCLDPEERRCFSEALARAARSPDEPVRVIFTLRDDFLARTEQLPALRHRLGLGLQLLTTPAPEELVRMLVEPARHAGYDFEARELPLEMVSTVADQPGALALLSFTASKLWAFRDRHFKHLPTKAYRQMGGVGGALAQHAEEMLAALPNTEQRLVREAFRHLVTAEGTRAVLTRVELLKLLGGGHSAAAAVERLISARLLVASEGVGGEERVEVIHEALLSSWPRLVAWRQEDSEGARLRDQLRVAARQWEERGRPRGLLWRDEALAEYRLWRIRHPGLLAGLEEEFGQASLAEASRSRRNRWLALASVMAALLGGLVVATVSARQARVSAQESRERLLALYEEQGRQFLLAGDPIRAFAYLNEAFQGGRTGAGVRFMLAQASHSLGAQRLLLQGHRGLVWDARFSPDGSLIATASADSTGRLWDARTGKPLFALQGHGDSVFRVDFSSDGKRLLTASYDNSIRIWDSATGALLRTITVLPGQSIGDRMRLGYASFSPDGRFILSADQEGGARIWDADNGQLIQALDTGANSLLWAVYDPAGTRIVTVDNRLTVSLWDARTGRRLATAGGEGTVSASFASPGSWASGVPRFSPDGKRFVTLGKADTALIWSTVDGTLVATLQGHSRQVRAMAFSPDGTQVVTASEDRTAKLWDVASGRLRATLEGHDKALTWAGFSRDGSRLFTLCEDGTARIWEASGRPIALLIGHQGKLTAGALDTAGRWFVTSSHDGTARLWDAAHEELRFTLRHPGSVNSASYSPDGQRILTMDDEGVARIWDARSGRLERSLGPFPQPQFFALWHPDGKSILTANRDTAQVLEPGSGRLLLTLAHGDDVVFASFSPEGGRIVVAGNSGKVGIYDARDGRMVMPLSGNTSMVLDARFDRSGTRVVTASVDHSARVWDASTGALLLSLPGHGGELLTAAFHPEGTSLLTGGVDRTARLWDLSKKRLLYSVQEHRSQVNRVNFNPDGTLFATAGSDGIVRIWDTQMGTTLGAFPALNTHWAEFSPDGRRVVAASDDGWVSVWDTRLDSRSPDEIAAFARCRVPFRVEAERLLPVPLEPSACDR